MKFLHLECKPGAKRLPYLAKTWEKFEELSLVNLYTNEKLIDICTPSSCISLK